ncbi:MAG: ATP-binding cassette domain-containing protein, partial [Bacteroidetes bacterium]|nr:ATP-binding cassette domain-containing protein [Bacteroidota bacterium]
MILLNIHKTLYAVNGLMNLDISATIEKNQLATIYGASGAGKTSALRMLAGLMDPDLGQITVNGKVWFDKEQKINLKPQHRKIGYVFQDYALFPNMTVRQNLEYGLSKNQDKNIIS